MKRILFLIIFSFLSLAMMGQSHFMGVLQQGFAKPERVYQFYVHQQADSIYAMGKAVFSDYFTAEQFAEQLRRLDERLGKPVEASMWEVKRQQGYEVYSRVLTFLRYTATLCVIFDASGNLVTLTLSNERERLGENERAITVVTDDTIRLPARLTLPPASIIKGKVPVAILVHGSGASNMDESVGQNAPFRDLAEGLARRGVAVVRYDKRTLVYPQLFEDEAKGYTYDEETVDDALSALRLVKEELSGDGTLQIIDTSRAYVIGHSLGAMMAPRIADRSGRVAGIVLLAAPTTKLRPTLERQMVYLGVSQDTARLQTDAIMSSLPENYIDFDAHYSPVGTARGLAIPMLILQGERDYQVTMDDFAVWRAALGERKDVTLKSYPTLNHFFMPGQGKCMPSEYLKPGHVSEEVLDDIARFIHTVR